MKNVKVILWGLGAMGGGIGKMLVKKQGVDIVGAIDIGDKIGKSMYDVVPGIERGDREDVIVGTPEDVIKPGSADIVVVCTNSFTKDVYDKLVFVMERGINVITSAEEMAYPQAQEPELAKQLDDIAKKNGVTVLGTGINPGLIMDLLVILWTGACETVDHIVSRRVNSLSPFGPAVMEEQGIGMEVAEFEKRKAEVEEWYLSLREKRGCSSAGRASALHAEGQEFDPPHLHQLSLKKTEQGVTGNRKAAN